MKKLIISFALITSSLFAAAQQTPTLDARFGEDPATREDNAKLLNTLNYSYKLKDYPQAAKELQQLMAVAPRCSEDMYRKGVHVYRTLYTKTQDVELRKAYLDTMLMVFDKREEIYGDHKTRGRAYIFGQKALAFANFATEEDRDELHKTFIEAIKHGLEVMDKQDAILVGTYFSNLSENYKYDEITADVYIEKFEELSDLLSQSTDKSEIHTQIINDIEAQFGASGAASCENIERIFKPKYDAAPDNVDVMKKILGLFSRAKCNTPFQMEILEKYYNIDPQPEIAIMLAGVYEERSDFAKAQEFMKVAIENETDPTKKASFLLRAAGQLLGAEKYKEAAASAREAITLNDQDPMAFFIYASAVASGVATQCSGESRQFGFWLVYDTYAQALSRMSQDDPKRADTQNAMGQCRANFPKTEELFMLGLTDGSAYTVNCGWVNGRTTIRGR